MANTIKIKNSSTANSAPSVLEHGEIAINYTDGKIFYKNNSNTIVSFATSISINDLSDVVISSPASGDVLKYDGTNWVNDATINQNDATINQKISDLYIMTYMEII